MAAQREQKTPYRLNPRRRRPSRSALSPKRWLAVAAAAALQPACPILASRSNNTTQRGCRAARHRLIRVTARPLAVIGDVLSAAAADAERRVLALGGNVPLLAAAVERHQDL
jgi:hypothetical protein